MSEGTFQIRKATPQDFADVQACARTAYFKYVDRMGKEPAPMNADFSRQIGQGIVYVALSGPQFVGYVVFYPEGDHVHLENVGVLPQQAGKGFGNKLVAYVEHSARRDGFIAVELYTNEAMVENLAMYPKLGYIEIERKSQAGFNRVFFRKEL